MEDEVFELSDEMLAQVTGGIYLMAPLNPKELFVGLMQSDTPETLLPTDSE